MVLKEWAVTTHDGIILWVGDLDFCKSKSKLDDDLKIYPYKEAIERFMKTRWPNPCHCKRHRADRENNGKAELSREGIRIL